MDGPEAINNTFIKNTIHANQNKGIENLNGGNEELTPPNADLILGDLVGTTCPFCLVEAYADPAGQGRKCLASVNAGGVFVIPGTFRAVGADITCTATRAFVKLKGSTSEFGYGFEAPPANLDATEEDRVVGGGDLVPGGEVEYTVRIANDADEQLPDTRTDEFADPIPPGMTYVPGSLTVDGAAEDDGTGDGIGYDSENGVILWNGAIPPHPVKVITFRVRAYSFAGTGDEVSNQGDVLGLFVTNDPDTVEVDDPTVTPVAALSTELSVQELTATPSGGASPSTRRCATPGL